MLPFWFGCIAGAAPWVAIIVNLVGASSSATNGVPGFVYVYGIVTQGCR
jgi:hypothetical protein